jgi:hypothetical protein
MFSLPFPLLFLSLAAIAVAHYLDVRRRRAAAPDMLQVTNVAYFSEISDMNAVLECIIDGVRKAKSPKSTLTLCESFSLNDLADLRAKIDENGWSAEYTVLAHNQWEVQICR